MNNKFYFKIIFSNKANHYLYFIFFKEYLLIGASTVPPTLLRKIKNDLKLKHILVGLGLTESSAAGLCTKPEFAINNEKYAYESIGIPFPFV
jgi:hypothetical protein